MIELYNPDIVTLGDAIVALTPMKAKELYEYLEEVHGIKAAGMVIQQQQQESPKEEKPPEQTEWDVVITEFDASKKIGIVKEARTLTGLGLKESMALLTALPATIRSGIVKADAEKSKVVLEAAGAKVILK